MPTFSALKSVYQNHSGQGAFPDRIMQEQSKCILEHAWDRAPQRKTAYLYDAFHDSEPELSAGLNPAKDPLKTPVSIHFFSSLRPPEPFGNTACYIRFKPSYSCTVNYYREAFHRRYGAEFPTGLFIDIPDARGIYRRWLIMGPDDYGDLLCPQYRVYPVSYRLHWVEDSGQNRYLRKMWAAERKIFSRSSGTSTGHLFTSVKNETSLWLPMNPVTERLTYDQRLIVSAPTDCPLTWVVSKAENTQPFGISRLQLTQTAFDRHNDYVDLKTGEMYAGYYASSIIPRTPSEIYDVFRGEILVSSDNIRIGGGYKTLQAVWTDAVRIQPEDWSFTIDGEDASSLVSVKEAFEADVPAKAISAADTSAKDVPAKNVSAKIVSAKDVSSKDLSSKNVSAKDVSAKDVSAKDVSSKNISAKNVSAKNISAGEPQVDKGTADNENPVPNTIRLRFTGDYSFLTKKLLVCATDPVSGIRLCKELEIMSL